MINYVSVKKALPEKSCVVLVRVKNFYGDIVESKALYDFNSEKFYMYGSPRENVIEWAYRY